MLSTVVKLLLGTALCASLAACGGSQGGFNLRSQSGAAKASGTEAVADAAFAAETYDKAAQLYEKAAHEDPKSAHAYLGLGRSYIEMGQLGRAEFALQRANTLDKRNPEVLNELGNLKLRRLHPAEAIELYDRALRIDRRNLSALTGKAVSLDFLSRHGEAQEVYRQALQVYPSNFVLLSNYSLSQVLSGQIGTGLATMEELLRDPENGPSIRSNMALAYVLDGRRQDAYAMLTGTMSEADIRDTLNRYDQIRKQFKAGKPIGYMVFS